MINTLIGTRTDNATPSVAVGRIYAMHAMRPSTNLLSLSVTVTNADTVTAARVAGRVVVERSGSRQDKRPDKRRHVERVSVVGGARWQLLHHGAPAASAATLGQRATDRPTERIDRASCAGVASSHHERCRI